MESDSHTDRRFAGRGFGGGRGRGFGGGRGIHRPVSPQAPSRSRSPVQQIRRTRLEDGPSKPEQFGPGRGSSRPTFRGRGFSRGGFRPEISAFPPGMNMNSNAGPPSFPPPAPERVFRNSADAPPREQFNDPPAQAQFSGPQPQPLFNDLPPLAQFDDPPPNFQQQNNFPRSGFERQDPNNKRSKRPSTEDEPSGFANAGSGPQSNPWLSKNKNTNDNDDNSNPKSQGKSLLKPQYLTQALGTKIETPSRPTTAPPPPLLGLPRNQNQNQSRNNTNFGESRWDSSNRFEDPQSRKNSYEDPQSRKNSYEDPQSRKNSYEDPQSRKNSYEDPQSRKNSYKDPQSRKNSYEDPQSQKNSFEDPQSWKSPFEDPHSWKTPVEDPNSWKTPFEDPQSRKNSYENPQSQTNSFENPQSWKSPFEDPQSRNNSYENPQSQKNSFEDPQSWKSPFDDPHSRKTPFEDHPSHFPPGFPGGFSGGFQQPPPNYFPQPPFNQTQPAAGPPPFNNFVSQNSPFDQQSFQQQLPIFPSFLSSPPPGNNNFIIPGPRNAEPIGVSVEKPKSLLDINPNNIDMTVNANQTSSTNVVSKGIDPLPAVVSTVGGFFQKPPMRYDGQSTQSQGSSNSGKDSLISNTPQILTKLPTHEEIALRYQKQLEELKKKAGPELNRVKPQPPPPPKIGVTIPTIPSSVSPPPAKGKPLVDYNPPSPPSPSPSPPADQEPYEIQFMELISKYELKSNISPKIKTGDNGKKVYSFIVEFGRDGKVTQAEGQYFPSLDNARDNAYSVACKKVMATYGSDSDQQRKKAQAEVAPSQNSRSDSRGVFRSQQSWPNNCAQEAEREGERSFGPPRPSASSQPLPPPPPANNPMPVPPPSTNNDSNKQQLYSDSQPHPHPHPPNRGDGSGSGQVQNVFSRNMSSEGNTKQIQSQSQGPDRNSTPEERFKNYMDILHMQCWLKPHCKQDRGWQLGSFEIEVQSYDKKFQKSFYGEYFPKESAAKESAFDAACNGLERNFARELAEAKNKEEAPNQRAFMDLRSILGLTVNCKQEKSHDFSGQPTVAFNIEFSRGQEPETVYGEFYTDEKKSREKAYELATWRVKYLYGPELDIDFKNFEQNNDGSSIQPPRNQHQSFMPQNQPQIQTSEEATVDWQPPNKRLYNDYNPHYTVQPPPVPPSLMGMGSPIGKNLAYIPPTVKSQQPPPTSRPRYQYQEPPPTPSQNQMSPPRSRTPIEDIRSGSNRVHEELFKQYTSFLSLEYNLRKIPKFEGLHKIFAYEVKFKSKTGNSTIQQSMGEYFRDEGMAKENAFKYACELLSSKFGPAIDNLQDMNRFF